MLVKSQAIVLRTYKYSETSIIAKMYTKDYGLLSFIVHGVRKRKSKYPASFFQAMQIVNLEINYKEKSNLHNIKEISLAAGLHNIQTNLVRSSISLFLAEVLFKTIQEEEANTNLFEFITNSIAFLEEADEKNITNFHLVFLLQLSQHLGFYPKNNYEQNRSNFNMLSGEFDSKFFGNKHLADYYFDDNMSSIFHKLLNANYSNMNNEALSSKARRQMLNNIISFFQIQLPEMGNIQSLEVLETVFS